MTKRSNLTHKVEEIDVDTAIELLNDDLPNFSAAEERQVASLAEDMKEGRWVLNGNAIIVADSGKILDGKKRLAACFREGASFKTLVVRGVPESYNVTIGTHKKRTHNDYVKTYNIDHHSLVTYMVSKSWAFKDGSYDPKKKLNINELLSLYKAYQSSYDAAAQFASNKENRFLINRNRVSLFTFLLSCVDEDLALKFIQESLADHDLVVPTPAGLLNKRVRRDPNLKEKELFALIIKAWNAYRAKQEIAVLKYQSAANEEVFPTIEGWEENLDFSLLKTAQQDSFDGEEKDEIEVSIESISPEIARKYLDVNTENNRNIAPKNMSVLAREMTSGRWRLNGESIKFDTDGRLIDGQHRLTAVIKSGCTIESLVVRNVPHHAFLTYDGSKYNSYDTVLKRAGVRYPNRVTPLCRFMHLWDKGIRSHFSTHLVSNQELEEYLDKHAYIRDWVSDAGINAAYDSKNYVRFCDPRVLAFIYTLARRKHSEEMAETYMRVLLSGIQEDLQRDKVLMDVRNVLIRIKDDRQRGKVNISGSQKETHDMYALMVGWNLWVQKKQARSSNVFRYKERIPEMI